MALCVIGRRGMLAATTLGMFPVPVLCVLVGGLAERGSGAPKTRKAAKAPKAEVMSEAGGVATPAAPHGSSAPGGGRS